MMGASLAMAGVSGCRYPVETIEPFVIRPEGRMPGEAYNRATNFELAGRVYNLLIKCVDGRPLKIEPNVDHPGGGGTDVYSQASILGLYDPDRARGDDGLLIRKGEKRREPADWDDFDSYGLDLIKAAEKNNSGGGFAVLMSPTSSPSTVRLGEGTATAIAQRIDLSIRPRSTVTRCVKRPRSALGKPADPVARTRSGGRDRGVAGRLSGQRQRNDLAHRPASQSDGIPCRQK